MWSTDVFSKAWPLLWRAASSLFPKEEGSSLRGGSRRWRQLLNAMASISLRFTTPTDPLKKDFIARRKTLGYRPQPTWRPCKIRTPSFVYEHRKNVAD